MSAITFKQADIIISTALRQSCELQLKPLSIVVVDAGGHLIASKRGNGASTLRPHIAWGKAGGALALGFSSRKIADMSGERPSFVASLGKICVHRIIPAAGGLNVVDSDERPIGAVGVSGDTSDNDERCALQESPPQACRCRN